MKSAVKVTGDAAGNVVITSENPEFSYIRLEQKKLVVNDVTGFMDTKNVTALLHGKTVQQKDLGLKVGDEMEGKIITRESLVPFDKKNPERDIKVAGDTKVVLTVNGQPIYRKSFYTTDMSKSDELIQHDNVEAIRIAKKELEAQGAGKGADLNVGKDK